MKKKKIILQRGKPKNCIENKHNMSIWEFYRHFENHRDLFNSTVDIVKNIFTELIILILTIFTFPVLPFIRIINEKRIIKKYYEKMGIKND